MGNVIGSLFRLRQVSFMPWHFKSGDNSSPRGNVEGCRATGYISIQTVCLCCGLISIGHGLSFTCFGWVLKGLLVFGAVEHITLPLELFATTIGLV